LNLGEVAALTGAEILTGDDALDVGITQAGAADLLSDLLALVEDEGVLLVTGSTTPQVLRVAEVLGLAGILFVRGKRPTESMSNYAREASLPLMVTQLSMFDTCGVLYSNGMRGLKRLRFPDGRGRGKAQDA